jgi:hypothetical protein
MVKDTNDCAGFLVDPEDPRNLTSMASAEIHLGGTAVTKTIGKMLDRQTSQRMLHRQPTTTTGHSLTPPSQVHSSAWKLKYSPQFLQACTYIFQSYDTENTGRLALDIVPSLLRYHNIEVDDQKFAAWQQRPRARDGDYANKGTNPAYHKCISFGEFVDACFTLVGPSLLPSLIDPNDSIHRTHHHHLPTSVSGNALDTTAWSSSADNEDPKNASFPMTSPLPLPMKHPFQCMQTRDQQAQLFSYSDHVSANPIEAQRVVQDTLRLAQSQSIQSIPTFMDGHSGRRLSLGTSQSVPCLQHHVETHSILYIYIR